MPLAVLLLLLVALGGGLACGAGDAPPAEEKETAPAAEGFAPVHGDGKLYYQVRGEGHPVVLIHGGSTHVGMWDDQFDVLARHYRVVRYDVRGFGRSSTSQVRHSQWHDLRKLLDPIAPVLRRIGGVLTLVEEQRARVVFGYELGPLNPRQAARDAVGLIRVSLRDAGVTEDRSLRAGLSATPRAISSGGSPPA